MICNKCGMMNPDGQQFCGNCGSPLMMPSQPVMPPPIAKKDNKNTILIVIAVLLGVIVGVLIVWLIVSSRNSGKTVEDDDDDDIVIEVVDKKSQSSAPAENSLPQSHSSLDVIADGDYSSTYLSDDYLNGFSKKELRVMRNAIYARHGRYFQSSDLQQIFDRRGWYSPYQQEVPINELNAVEKANIKKIQSWEKVK